jgi:hypothetical protein
MAKGWDPKIEADSVKIDKGVEAIKDGVKQIVSGIRGK